MAEREERGSVPAGEPTEVEGVPAPREPEGDDSSTPETARPSVPETAPGATPSQATQELGSGQAGSRREGNGTTPDTQPNTPSGERDNGSGPPAAGATGNDETGGAEEEPQEEVRVEAERPPSAAGSGRPFGPLPNPHTPDGQLAVIFRGLRNPAAMTVELERKLAEMLGAPLDRQGSQPGRDALDNQLGFTRGTVAKVESGSRRPPHEAWDSYRRHLVALDAPAELIEEARRLHEDDAEARQSAKARHQQARRACGEPPPPDDPDGDPAPDDTSSWRELTIVLGLVLALVLALFAVLVLFPAGSVPGSRVYSGPKAPVTPPAPAPVFDQCVRVTAVPNAGSQCIGRLLNPAAIPAEFELGPVLARINEENRQVWADPRAVTPAVPGLTASTAAAPGPTGLATAAVTVAYMLPLPSQPSSFTSELRLELEGVALAQHRYNTRGSTGDLPKIRVIVFNTGPDSQYYRDVLPQLDLQLNAGDRIVAAMGLGQSQPATRELIDQLNARGILTLPTRATADVLTASAPDPATGVPPVPPALLRVAPPNARLASAAARELLRIGATRVALVQGGPPDDPYAANLARTFQGAISALPGSVLLPTLTYDPSENGLGTAFNADSSVPQLCRQRPSALYVAGRGIDIVKLLISINASPDCQQSGPITVLAGDEGVDVLNQLRRALADPSASLDRDVDNEDLIEAFNNGKFRFEYTALTHPDLIPTGSDYGDVLAPLKPLLDDPALQEGATMLGYDTDTVAMECIRRASTQQTVTPAPSTVLNASRTMITAQRPVLGVTGPLVFGADGQAVARPVPVVQVNADGGAPELAIYRN